jgi:GTP-binding protein
VPVPRIAIVGRPNVGKSSLLNMLAGERVAIVDPTPGVTRDRVSVLVDLHGPGGEGRRTVELTDTGGFGVYVAEGGRYDDVGADLATLTGDIETQIGTAVSSADLILFAIDTQAGITPQDEEIARLLREQRLGSRQRDDHLVPVMVVATKCDGPKWEAHAFEFSALGFGEPMMCSSKNNYLRRSLVERLYADAPRLDDETPEPEADLKIAIVGKRNTGKSTLVNTLAGQPRVIVSEIAGTTRDAVDVRLEYEGRSIIAIDTAGLRRKKSFSGPIEWYAFDRAKRSIERSDVVLLLIDATERLSQVDEHLADLVQKSFKPVVLVVNKWDLAEGKPGPNGKTVKPADYETYLRKELKGLSFAPIAIVSAEKGLNLPETMDLAFELHEQSSTRVSTSKLNNTVRAIVDKHHPAAKHGKLAKVFYATQVKADPPTIVMLVNDPDLFTTTYMRYMMNRFRETLPFAEVPIQVLVRDKRKAERRGADFEIEETLESAAKVFAREDRERLEEMPDEAAEYFDD